MYERWRRMRKSLRLILLCMLLLAAPSACAAQQGVRYAVDFAYLAQTAPGSIAWLYQQDSTINQPVMFSTDRAYYLHRRFNGQVHKNGAIFATGEHAPTFREPVVTLYGKNCLDDSLLGSLSLYREDAYYRAHPSLTLLTPEGDYQLDIFAGLRLPFADQTWRVSENENLMQRLPGILAASFLTPIEGSLPETGDDWVILATDDTQQQRTRYVLYARKRALSGDGASIAYVNQLEMDARPTQTRMVTVPGVGVWRLYAQNDPLWNRLIFEVQTSDRRRPFGDGGCGPTAVAMAVSNLVPTDRLPRIAQHAASPYGYRFCSCSVNEYWCSGHHVPYRLQTPEQYARYFPLVVASFATGNNEWGVRGRSERFGTNMNYVEKLCSVYGITTERISSMRDVPAALHKEGTMVLACAAGAGNPFTKTSHFLVLAGTDDEYLYALDPLRRESYRATDPRGLLQVMVPGLVRIRLESAGDCHLSPMLVLRAHNAAN